jgi:hypothetical protein
MRSPTKEPTIQWIDRTIKSKYLKKTCSETSSKDMIEKT